MASCLCSVRARGVRLRVAFGLASTSALCAGCSDSNGVQLQGALGRFPQVLREIRDRKGSKNFDIHASDVLKDFPAFKGAVYHSGVVMFHNSCLSNWWAKTFYVEHDGKVIDFHFSECLIMSIKERICTDGDLGAILRKHADLCPGPSKTAANQVGGDPFPLWGDHAFQVLLGGVACMCKFSQNADLSAFLLNTGDAVLVETAPHDGAWGVAHNSSDFIAKGLCPQDYTVQSTNEELFTFQAGKWKGQRKVCEANALGKCLMLVRSILRRHPGEVTTLHAALDLVWEEIRRTPACAIRGLPEAHSKLRELIGDSTGNAR